MSRRRCARRECRHAPSGHEGASGRCLLGCSCSRWLDSKRHEWRDQVADSWRTATLTWLAERERVAIGYATEMREFEAHHPRPLLADHMLACSPGTPPEQVERLTLVDVCSHCRGTGRRLDADGAWSVEQDGRTVRVAFTGHEFDPSAEGVISSTYEAS